MQYEPDSWVIVKITSTLGQHYRVLAGWSGSYLYGSSWKLNSGIVRYEDVGNAYNFYGDSGSVYTCYKTGERMNGIMSMTFANLAEQNSDTCWIEVVSIKEFLDNFVEMV